MCAHNNEKFRRKYAQIGICVCTMLSMYVNVSAYDGGETLQSDAGAGHLLSHRI